jgi:hypothetical protein
MHVWHPRPGCLYGRNDVTRATTEVDGNLQRMRAGPDGMYIVVVPLSAPIQMAPCSPVTQQVRTHNGHTNSKTKSQLRQAYSHLSCVW